MNIWLYVRLYGSFALMGIQRCMCKYDFGDGLSVVPLGHVSQEETQFCNRFWFCKLTIWFDKLTKALHFGFK